MSYAAWSVNAGDQPTTSKWNILGTNDSSFNDGSGFAWGSSAVLSGGPAAVSFTPTWTGSTTNPTIGNGTLDGHYIQIGKTVWVRIGMLAGSTTTFGSGTYSFALPVTANSALTSGAYTNLAVGSCIMNGASTDPGIVVMATTTTVKVLNHIAPSTPPVNITAGFIGASGPLSWASGNSIVMSFTYESA